MWICKKQRISVKKCRGAGTELERKKGKAFAKNGEVKRRRGEVGRKGRGEGGIEERRRE